MNLPRRSLFGMLLSLVSFPAAAKAGYKTDWKMLYFRQRLAEQLHENGKLKDEIEQLRVQLAGCSVAALGATWLGETAKKGDYGWSAAYQDVLELRQRYDYVLDLAKG